MRVAYDELIPSLKTLLPEQGLDVLGRAVAFIRRLREIRASAFVWAVVLSRFGTGAPAFTQARQWYQRLTGKEIFPRPFQMRFKSQRTVALFERAFAQAVAPWHQQARRPRHPIARHFSDIVAVDSTVIRVAALLRRFFKGTRSAKAELKVLLAISLYGLVPLFAEIVPGNRHDMVCFPPLSLLRRGTLLLFDKGFVSYERLRDIMAAHLFYLCPMRHNGNPRVVAAHSAPAKVRNRLKRNPSGITLRAVLPRNQRIGRMWDLEVEVVPNHKGANHTPVRTRLVIVPGREGKQRPYLTNLCTADFCPAALRELYRLRWQVELAFKELKQHLNLDHLPTKDPYAVQVFVWASLTALALSRTVAGWICPLAKLVGLGSRIRPMLLTRALRGTVRLLGRALVEPVRRAPALLKIFAEELVAEARTLEVHREDTFQRLLPMLADQELA